MSTLVVVQFRTNESGPHEIKCLQDELKAYDVELKFIDAIEEEINKDLVKQADGVILGGSGEFHLTKGDGEGDWVEPVFEFLDEVMVSELPTLGICFGSQILARHQGCELSHKEEYHETGSFEVMLQKEAQGCEIFSQLPESFNALTGHKDTMVNMSDNVIPLAKSKRAPNHAFKVKNKPVWGVLFHPELDKQKYRERLAMFLEYLPENKSLDEVMEEISVKKVPLKVLHSFVHKVLKHGGQKPTKNRKHSTNLSMPVK